MPTRNPRAITMRLVFPLSFMKNRYAAARQAKIRKKEIETMIFISEVALPGWLAASRPGGIGLAPQRVAL